ncbi:MAG: sulfite exporter TauE/SafE family protein [Lachnospiraceae bacterium]
MLMETLAQGASAAVSTGLGCGTCCSPGITAFLSGYTMTHAKNTRQSFAAFFWFYFGKVAAVVAVCVMTSFLGKEILEENGTIGGLDIRFCVNLVMAVVSVVCIIRWILEKCGKITKCKSCHSCQETTQTDAHMSYAALWGLGAGYGITPCAPLIFMAGYAATIPVWSAAVSGLLFALASSISPMLMLCVLTGFLTGPLRKEIPQYLQGLRLICYVLLLVFSVSAML